MSEHEKCVYRGCDADATKRLTPDLDIRGVPVCDAHVDLVWWALICGDIEETKRRLKKGMVD